MPVGAGVAVGCSGVKVGVGINPDKEVLGDVEEPSAGERTEEDSTAIIASRSVVLAK